MFPTDYQDELLIRMTDRDFMKEVGPILKPEWFDPERMPVALRILSTWRRGQTLSAAQLSQAAARAGFTLKSRSRDSGDPSFDREEVIAQAKRHIFDDQLLNARVLSEQGRFSEAVLEVRKSLDMFPQSNHQAPDILKSKDKMPVRERLIPTGIPKLDGYLRGGTASGDLAVILAPTSGGKTSWLIWVACTAVLKGLRVYYVTLEVPRTEIEAKSRRCLMGKDEPSPRAWTRWVKANAKKKSRLQVQEHAPYTIAVSDLEAEMGEDTDLLIVDYADYLKPPGGGREGLEYHTLGAIYGHLKRVAMDRGISVWTASQVNRDAYMRERISLSDVESSLKKVMVVDQALALTLKARNEHHGKLYVAKNRHGPRLQEVPVTVNWATSRFTVGTWAEEEE